MLKSGLFNFQASNYSRGDFSIASVLLGGSQIYSYASKSINDLESNANKSGKMGMANRKKKIVRKFSRFKTQGQPIKLSDDSSSDSNSSKASYLLEDENVSNGDHDNPAGELINLYQ